ncbi:hypothetical protein BRETT_001902 [Brettanomyces bruxellensis]|uniref:S-formylglutathione hydrolase n=1 Tax=Dekkera bruxellensis TaxID=5007 RepID=A0A871R795_DEKBR|nr:uncharacterized protein BRETT_001902 [Brettanomyces bruxellensis]QOU21739.1 hypothetical protein BRETT_001902 [Brettanomyces bruxellensis]
MNFNIFEQKESFGGKLLKLTHNSSVTHTTMTLNLYLPHQYFDCHTAESLPIILFLAGFGCNPNNPSEKSFIQPYANEYGFAVLMPDTSPRVKDGQYKLGDGANFYLDATQKPWDKMFNMYSYIIKDLIPNIGKSFKILDLKRMSICGHSMGGLGSLLLFLKNPNLFKCCSAFAPLTHPMVCPGENKYFKIYLGSDKLEWSKYDPCELIKAYVGPKRPILIFQGTSDKFYIGKELLPEQFLKSSKGTLLEGLVDLRLEKGYDHSYYFVSSFMSETCAFHAKYLGLA